MGVYLSNIEMPRTHPITVEIYPDGTVLSKTVGRRDIHGTAIPVPPHGRLIDADALAEKIDGIWDCNDMVFRPNDKICKIPEDCKGCKWAQTKDFIKRMVENATTVIEAEEEET